MELLMAIALLCQSQVGVSKKNVDAYQLKCQQEYLKCYMDLEQKDVTTGPAITEMAKQKKYLYQCVLERKINVPLCEGSANNP
jgi:hypothetical protein